MYDAKDYFRRWLVQEGFLFLELFSLETIGVCGGLPEMDSRSFPLDSKMTRPQVWWEEAARELKAEE